MFTSEKLTLITIDPIYMKALLDSCDEVFYRPKNYDNKPYLGILIHENGRECAIPLTSAKDKHKSLKIFDKGLVVIHENISELNMDQPKMKYHQTFMNQTTLIFLIFCYLIFRHLTNH